MGVIHLTVRHAFTYSLGPLHTEDHDINYETSSLQYVHDMTRYSWSVVICFLMVYVAHT